VSRLEGRIALITGGTAGLGKAAAIRLAKEGAAIEILDLKAAGAVCEEIRAAGGTATSAICDCADEEQIARAVKEVAGRHDHIDILVNNAGILTARKPWLSLTNEEVERYIHVNYVGYFLVTKAFYPLIRKSATPRIIMVASRTYFLANPGQLAYVASKGAVMGMTRVLAKELGDEGIPVNAVMPGMVATPGTMEHSAEEAFNRVMGNQAIKKRVTPEHLAGLIAFLASDDGELITGQTILCDGGGYLH
jgi:NAD(P)-dependent dehydrogenase (short-subunit alcohol dehydrogenase family)